MWIAGCGDSTGSSVLESISNRRLRGVLLGSSCKQPHILQHPWATDYGACHLHLQLDVGFAATFLTASDYYANRVSEVDPLEEFLKKLLGIR